jgi:hypothetical protein
VVALVDGGRNGGCEWQGSCGSKTRYQFIILLGLFSKETSKRDQTLWALGDDLWPVLLGEGLLATLLSFGRRLPISAGSTAAVGACTTPRGARPDCGGAELGRILRLTNRGGKAEHVRELVRPCRATRPLLQALINEPSFTVSRSEGEESAAGGLGVCV